MSLLRKATTLSGVAMHEIARKGAAKMQHATELMNPVISWDDLRIFIACVESGSFRAAGRALNLDSATIVRRIDRLEHQLEEQLFNRLAEGIVLTDEGSRIIQDARAMEKASFNIVRQRQINDKDLHGLVRVAITEGLGTYWLLPRLLDFQKANRLLTIEMQCTMLPTDVGRLEADISVQFIRPERPDLIAVRLGFLHIYPFASPGYVRLYGLPSCKEEIGRHRIIQQVSPLLDESAYARNLGLDKVEGIVGVRTNASSALLYAVERDAGIGFLPTYAPALGAKLVPVDMDVRYRLEIWMTYHADLRQSRRHMVVVEWMRRIFDAKRFLCFSSEFIHPYELVQRMSESALANSVAGYAAAEPRVEDYLDKSP
jgi:DNA-binding transcriptional LysR family regulator